MHGRSARLVILTFVVAACAHAPAPPTPHVVQQGRRLDPDITIGAAELRRDVFAFADDSFHGRETGSADAYRAAAFLARRAQRLGLEPAGDSLYLQRVPMVRESFGRASRITVTSPNGRIQQLRLGGDVAPIFSVGAKRPEPARNADGEIVFLGYGPTTDDESAELARFDLEGKVLVALHGAPRGAPRADTARLVSYQALMERLARLASLHPAAVIVLMTPGHTELYDYLLPQMLRRVMLQRADTITPDSLAPDSSSARRIPLIMVGVARRGSPLLPAGWPNDVSPQSLGRQFTAQLEIDRQPFTGYNVAAVVRGSDPRLKMTYLAFGAHYDHLGIVHSRVPTNGWRAKADTIANGANDDASGSVALLAIARQMMRASPRRSVLFVWHTAGEQGMLGSEYFTAHPTVPIDSIVAEFNADMIGGNSEKAVGLVGPRAAPDYLSWRLGMIVDSVNRAFATPIKIDRRWDDPDDPDFWYRRSDHYNYAAKNIPVIFFSTGCDSATHSVHDEPQTIDYEQLARIAQLMLESGLAVADRTSRPTSEVLAKSISSR